MLRNRYQREQGRGACGPVHHADQYRAVAMPRRCGAGTRLPMQMRRLPGMAVIMQMHAAPPQIPQHPGTDQHQHPADQRFRMRTEAYRNREAQQQHRGADRQQAQSVANGPARAKRECAAPARPGTGQARHGHDVIGIQRMHQPEAKCQGQHGPPIAIHIMPPNHESYVDAIPSCHAPPPCPAHRRSRASPSAR